MLCHTVTEYVETCQPTYGGNVLLATYGEDESGGGADCQTIPVNNCRNVAKPNCRKIADEQCRKVEISKQIESIKNLVGPVYVDDAKSNFNEIQKNFIII